MTVVDKLESKKEKKLEEEPCFDRCLVCGSVLTYSWPGRHVTLITVPALSMLLPLK